MPVDRNIENAQKAEEIAAAVAAERKRCASICALIAKDLAGHSARAEMRGDADAMYRANTAWHRINEAEELINRPDYLKPKAE